MDKVKVFAPATVANVGSGFDVLGFAMEAPGDIIEMNKSDKEGINITEMISEKPLSTVTEENTAGMALLAMYRAKKIPFGVELKITKGVNPGSGTGSSAASAAGAVYALNQLLNDEDKFSDKELVDFAMDGEIVASGARHADNVGPCVMGGFTLVRQNEPLDIVAIPAPDELYVTVLHPEIEIKTSESRAILKKQIAMSDAVKQWGNVAGLVAGLFTNDYELIGRSMEDYIVVPTRSLLIPMFDIMKQNAMNNGALGFSISGSGPSVFALCKGKENAESVKKALIETIEKTELAYNIHISKVSSEGCKVID
ncbi:MAG: homoserine kinase [Ichthyobacteriaceae bacterium]|nr:homoserine kinase [Ichthyobacteriaceae bacterium]